MLLRIPFPDTCIVCGNPVESKYYACEKCQDSIQYINSQFRCKTCLGFLHNAQDGICGSCLLEKPQYSRLISCVKYEGEIKKTILLFKFFNRPDYHIGFSRLACKILEQENVRFDAVVCVPLHKKSLKMRGYNQSALIAKRIAEHFNVPFYEDLIVKTKNTKRQSELKLSDRKKNIKGAFKLSKPKRIEEKTVLLVDDIYTSGSTIKEAAKTCAQHCKDIVAFTVARTQFKY